MVGGESLDEFAERVQRRAHAGVSCEQFAEAVRRTYALEPVSTAELEEFRRSAQTAG